MNSKPPLVVSALRARMGTWMYYIGFMRMGDIANRISIAEDIHSSKTLSDLLQRNLTDRGSEIATYLLTHDQRFFNSLVVGTYGGDPQWYELSVRAPGFDEEDQVRELEGTVGFLRLDGSEILFAIDGQHRVAGIQKAIQSRPDMADEEVAVIFVAGVAQEFRHEDPQGFERTRRLFTTLNRYAKPVSKRDIIALDEDDVVAIITRRMVEDYPLFSNRISIDLGKNISAKDKRNITTIIALYDALDLYLPERRRGWLRFKKSRPPDSEIDRYYDCAVELWDTFQTHFEPLREISYTTAASGVEQYRNESGGHLLLRPVGLFVITSAVKRLVNDELSVEEAVERVAGVPMQLNSEPWVGLLWDDVNRRMITTQTNQSAAARLLYYAIADIEYARPLREKLLKELSGLLNKPEDQISLPR